MSIDIQADFINYVGDGKLEITEPEKFAKLSSQLLDLIRLQISKLQDRSKLKLFIQDHKIILSFAEDDSKQADLDEGNIENILVESLAKKLKQVKKYHELVVNSKITEAEALDLKNNSHLSKAANILNKIESTDIELVSSGNVTVKIPQLPKIDIKTETYQPMSLLGCRITKPELIGQMEAIFVAFLDNKKVTATLKILEADEQLVCDMAFNKKEVNIEFEYLVSIKKSKHYKGTLTSIEKSDQIETNIELELDL
ncbi:MAG: hypothetical protein OCD00_03705 [Colwellia sp.]